MNVIKITPGTHTTGRRIVVVLFAAVSTGLFLYLNKVQPNYYIDEIFHVPQTLRFCEGNFKEWDQKITTFPGLYLIAISVLAPLNLCSTTLLRGINLLGTFSNFYVIYELLKFTGANETSKNLKREKIPDQVKTWRRFASSLNVALLPPLYFLLFLYYTDVVSTNMVLLTYLLYLKKSFKTSALIGVFAVLLRQTNIVWVAWVSLEIGLDIIESKNRKRIGKGLKNGPAHIKLLWENLREEVAQRRLTKLCTELVSTLFPFASVGISFVLFVIWNGGIVLGDRSAHVATIHLPQIFYYSVFTAFFCWPYFLPHLKDFLRVVKNRPVFCVAAFALMGIVVRFNTLAHPYLLADNRHYTFYVWNKIIGRHYVVRYILVPVYGFCLYCIYRGIEHFRFLSQIGYCFSVLLVLVPQLLLEPRYFFIPYIVFRVNLKKTETWQIVAELATTLAVNAFQFFIFSNKVFYWDDDVNPQRISW